MALQVWTARISSRDSDRFDITRKSGEKAFAPSWGTLRPVLEARKENRPLTDLEWQEYARKYLAEMTRSYRVNKAIWEGLLTQERVVFVCYCTDPRRCHRTILAKIFARLGAEDCGELSPTSKTV